MHSKCTPSNAGESVMCDNSQPFNYEWLQAVTFLTTPSWWNVWKHCMVILQATLPA